MITGALTGVSPQVFVFHSPRNFHCAEIPALSSILGTVEVPPEPFLSKLLTCPQTISLFTPPNTHVKPRRQIVLPHFTDELRGLKEIEQVAQSDPASVQWRQLCASELWSLLPFCVFVQPRAAAIAQLPLVSLGVSETPLTSSTLGILQAATHLGRHFLKLGCCCRVLNLR